MEASRWTLPQLLVIEFYASACILPFIVEEVFDLSWETIFFTCSLYAHLCASS